MKLFGNQGHRGKHEGGGTSHHNPAPEEKSAGSGGYGPAAGKTAAGSGDYAPRVRVTSSDSGNVFSPETPPAPRQVLYSAGNQDREPRRAVQPAAREAAYQTRSTPVPENWAEPRKKRPWLVVILCIAVLLAGSVLAYSIWDRPPVVLNEGPVGLRTDDSEQEQPPQSTAAPASTAQPVDLSAQQDSAEGITPDGRKPDCYTFLITAKDQIGSNTDTIIVGRFDTKNGELNLVSVPRDTLVDQPGSAALAMKKINAVYGVNGNNIDAMKEALADILGFRVDCYALVNIKALERMVDAIGGVYYDVPRNMYYDDPEQDLHIHIDKGYQLLNGENTVKVLRYRMGNNGGGYANGDLGRIETQQDFLLAIAGQMLTLGNIPHLTEAIQIFTENVDTDLTSGNMAFFARQFLSVDRENISFDTVPGSAITISGVSYYQINISEWVSLINEKLNPFTAEITVDNLDILRYEGGRFVSTQ